MKRFIFFSDTHLGFDFPLRPRIFRRRRGKDFFRNFRYILETAKQVKADAVLHGGDLFFRSKVPASIVTQAYEILFSFAENEIPFLIVPGNHERSQLPQSILTRHPFIYVFDEPKTFHLDLNGIQLAVSGFPYSRNIRTNFRNLLDKTGWERQYADIRLLIFHQIVEGAQIWNHTFRSGENIIPTNKIPNSFQAVLAGHIHRNQVHTLGEKKVPLIFSGSTERTSFLEMREGKGFFLLDFAQACDGWILSDTKFCPLKVRPMREIFLNGNQDKPQIAAILEKEIAELESDAIVNIICSDERTRSRLTAEFLREIFPQTMNFRAKIRKKIDQ